MTFKTPTVRPLIFVDCETTGLDPETDELVEMSWAFGGNGGVNSMYFGVQEVPEFIDSLIGFTERSLAKKEVSEALVMRFMTDAEGATMVSANPAFDKAFLEKAGLFPFYYRMLDIESYAMAKLNMKYVPGMNDLYNLYTLLGHKVTEPLHTAASDVQAMRDIFKLLNKE